jgi:hypothetical protein
MENTPRSAYPLVALATSIILAGCAATPDTRRASQAAPPPSPLVPATTTTAMAAETDAAAGAIPAYETISQLKSIPPCKAIVVERRDVFSKLLRTPDGKRFLVGGGRGDQEVWHFLATLPDGKTCELPADFLAFESRKFYPTAEEIAAMPACKGTVIVAAPCYCMFRKAASEGGASNEVFVIGDPGSKRVVWTFLRTLEEGHTYELPAAFVEYRKSHSQDKDEQE